MPTAIHEHQIQPNHFIYRCLMLLKSKPSQVNSVCRYTEKNMEQYSEQWLNRCKLRVKESTLVKYHNILEKHISPVFNSLPISQVTSEVVQQFTEQLLKEKKLSPKTVRDILTVLKAIFFSAP